MARLGYDLLFRPPMPAGLGPFGDGPAARCGCWLVGLGGDDPVWGVTVLTKSRDRLLAGGIAAKLCRAVPGRPRVEALPSDDHFSVDGSLIQAWASMRSFRPKDGSGEPPAPGRNGLPSGGLRPNRGASGTFMGRSEPTRVTARRRILRPGCCAGAGARRPSSASLAIC